MMNNLSNYTKLLKIFFTIFMAVLLGALAALVLLSRPAQAQGGADLALVQSVSSDPATVGQPLTYTLVITNNGADLATSVSFTDTLGAGATFSSVTASQGNCSGIDPITCNLGNLDNGVTSTVTIVVTPTTVGLITNMASVTSTISDPDLLSSPID